MAESHVKRDFIETEGKKKGAPFLIKGADGKTIKISAGEWYINTKARPRRMMMISLSPEAWRVYECLELATMGWSREKAVTMKGGTLRSLTPSDIRDETGLSKQHVRRALAELEEAGLIERRGVDGGPLHKGKVEIYCWAVPREPKAKNGSQRAATIPDWFPESWEALKPLISRLKLAGSIEKATALDPLLGAEGAEIAENLRKAEDQAKEFLARISTREKNGSQRAATISPEPMVASTHQNGVCALQNGVCAEPEIARIREITKGTERNIETASGGRADTVPEKPPVRPPDPSSKRTVPTPTEESLRTYLLKRPIKTPLDEPMFARISAHIPDQETLQRFQAVANEVKNPRKWPVYESIARQVHERGPINGNAAAMVGGIDMMEVARQVEELKAKGRRIRNG